MAHSELHYPLAFEEFREYYRGEPGIWARLECRHHQTLFDAACTEVDRLREEVIRLQTQVPHPSRTAARAVTRTAK